MVVREYVEVHEKLRRPFGTKPGTSFGALEPGHSDEFSVPFGKEKTVLR